MILVTCNTLSVQLFQTGVSIWGADLPLTEQQNSRLCASTWQQQAPTQLSSDKSSLWRWPNTQARGMWPPRSALHQNVGDRQMRHTCCRGVPRLALMASIQFRRQMAIVSIVPNVSHVLPISVHFSKSWPLSLAVKMWTNQFTLTDGRPLVDAAQVNEFFPPKKTSACHWTCVSYLCVSAGQLFVYSDLRSEIFFFFKKTRPPLSKSLSAGH